MASRHPRPCSVLHASTRSSTLTAKAEGPAIQYFHGDLTSQDCTSPEPGDAVLLFMVLQMAECEQQLQAMFHSAARIMKPGASLLAVVISPDYDASRQEQHELMMQECSFCSMAVPGEPHKVLFKMSGAEGVINHKHSKELLNRCLHNAGLHDMQLVPIKLQDEPASRALQVYMQNPHIIALAAKRACQYWYCRRIAGALTVRVCSSYAPAVCREHSRACRFRQVWAAGSVDVVLNVCSTRKDGIMA